MGLPSRSFAADAHDCIMVWIRMESTEYKCVARCSAPNGELPSDHLLPDPLTDQPYSPPRGTSRPPAASGHGQAQGPPCAWSARSSAAACRSAGDRTERAGADITRSLSRWVHRDLPRAAPPDSWRSLRSARVPPVHYLDKPPRPSLGATSLNPGVQFSMSKRVQFRESVDTPGISIAAPIPGGIELLVLDGS